MMLQIRDEKKNNVNRIISASIFSITSIVEVVVDFGFTPQKKHQQKQDSWNGLLTG